MQPLFGVVRALAGFLAALVRIVCYGLGGVVVLAWLGLWTLIRMAMRLREVALRRSSGALLLLALASAALFGAACRESGFGPFVAIAVTLALVAAGFAIWAHRVEPSSGSAVRAVIGATTLGLATALWVGVAAVVAMPGRPIWWVLVVVAGLAWWLWWPARSRWVGGTPWWGPLETDPDGLDLSDRDVVAYSESPRILAGALAAVALLAAVPDLLQMLSEGDRPVMISPLIATVIVLGALVYAVGGGISDRFSLPGRVVDPARFESG